MSFVKLETGAGEALRDILARESLSGPLRIDLRSTGCCDSSLGLWVDDARPTDLSDSIEEGLTIIISPELHRLTGEVTVSHDPDRDGFVLHSEQPISEWDGFGVCKIGIQERSGK